MTAHSLLLAAMTEYNADVEAAQAASSDAQMTAAKERMAARMSEYETVRAAEREAELKRIQEWTRRHEERSAEIVSAVPDCDRVFDAAGVLSLFQGLVEQGFQGPEEDYLRELLTLIRDPGSSASPQP